MDYTLKGSAEALKKLRNGQTVKAEQDGSANYIDVVSLERAEKVIEEKIQKHNKSSAHESHSTPAAFTVVSEHPVGVYEFVGSTSDADLETALVEHDGKRYTVAITDEKSKTVSVPTFPSTTSTTLTEFKSKFKETRSKSYNRIC